MTSELRIRPATHDDIGAVRRLLVETWHDTYDPLLGREKVSEITDKWHAEDVLARQLEAPGSSFLLAERGREAIGHAFAQMPQAATLVLARLYVRPAFQRRGIGGRLLAALIERHPEASRIRLTVEVDNVKGVAFYQRNGFAVTAEVVEDGLRGFRMERALERGGARHDPADEMARSGDPARDSTLRED